MNKKLLLVCLTIGIYLTGLLSGVVAGKYLFPRHRFGPPAHGPARPPDQMVNRFAKKLHLTEPQKAAVVAIMENNRSVIDKNRDEFHASMLKTITAVNASIREVLTDEQRQIFDTMIADGPGGQGFLPGRPDKEDMPPPPPPDTTPPSARP